MRADQQMLYVLIPLENHLNNLFNFWLGKGGIIEIQRHKWKHLGPTTRIFLVSHLKNDVLNCFTEENQIKVKILLFKLCNYFSDSYLKCIKVLPLKCIWLFPLSFEFALTLLGCLPSPSLMAQPERKVLKHHHPWHDTDTQNPWGMVLRAGHCKDLNTAFDTFCSSKTGN